jgi:5-hydroxyisourate hydrolase
MATVSSHILDSVSGRSAAGIRCQLYRIDDNEARQLVFDVSADTEGRIAERVEINAANRGGEFELVFHGSSYFSGQSVNADSMVRNVVIRFFMDDDQKRYHLPVMLSPHSYSTWWSG